jgi:hypothetical protein
MSHIFINSFGHLLFMSMGWVYVSELHRLQAFFLSPDNMGMERNSGMILTGETEELVDKSVQVPLSRP